MPVTLMGPAEPTWLDMPEGVRLQVRLIDPVAEMAMGQALADGHSKGLDLAQISLEQVVALARRTVLAWEGVDAPCTPANVEQLMRSGYRTAEGHRGTMTLAFNVAYGLARRVWSDEGEGYAASPNSTGEAAPDTAQTADA